VQEPAGKGMRVKRDGVKTRVGAKGINFSPIVGLRGFLLRGQYF